LCPVCTAWARADEFTIKMLFACNFQVISASLVKMKLFWTSLLLLLTVCVTLFYSADSIGVMNDLRQMQRMSRVRERQAFRAGKRVGMSIGRRGRAIGRRGVLPLLGLLG
ncbi:hypothetical protein T01_11346, partial [Trichinella spiralis]